MKKMKLFSWKLFLTLLAIETIAGVFYQRAGRWVFGPRWFSQSIVESFLHLVCLLIVFGPVIYFAVTLYLRIYNGQLQVIEDKNNKFESLFLRNSSPILVLDSHRKILRFNPAFESKSGYTLEDLRQMDEGTLQAVLGMRDWVEPIKRATSDETLDEFEIQLRTRDERTRVMSNSVIPMTKHGSVAGYYVVMRDITEAREAQLRLWRMAHFDSLTGLSNRPTFAETLELALNVSSKHGKRLAVLFVDLDGFKHINDALGHRVGDEVLRRVSHKLVACTETSATVARFGGDEFAILLPELESVDDATTVAQRILNSISSSENVDGRQLSVGASIGIAMHPVSGNSVESLLQSADVAMYEAKRNGRNRYSLHLPSMQKLTYSRLNLENDLRQSLKAKSGFFVEYQPQVDVKSGRIVSAEALVRWQHPTMGLVLPSEFIPVAEEIGLIRDIGRLVLREVCQHIKTREAAGEPPIRISVNVSGVELGEEDFEEEFLHTLKEFEVSPERIAIEITETSLAKDEEKVERTLRGLKQSGIMICVDDFGRGYNSLGLLKRLSVDVLKIDRMFVSNIHESLVDRSVVTALITMSHAHHWQVVAEGVETDESLHVLADEGCDTYQGFLFSPSISGDLFSEKFAAMYR